MTHMIHIYINVCDLFNQISNVRSVTIRLLFVIINYALKYVYLSPEEILYFSFYFTPLVLGFVVMFCTFLCSLSLIPNFVINF